MSQETPASPTEARIKTKRRISPFWLLPVIALMIAGWLIWTSYEDRGSTVTIDFQTADGIVAGRTPVRFQGLKWVRFRISPWKRAEQDSGAGQH
jgi:paraquat-inducible protein B